MYRAAAHVNLLPQILLQLLWTAAWQMLGMGNPRRIAALCVDYSSKSKKRLYLRHLVEDRGINAALHRYNNSAQYPLHSAKYPSPVPTNATYMLFSWHEARSYTQCMDRCQAHSVRILYGVMC